MLESLPLYALMIPLVLQGGVILFDEFYFHRRRGLGTWERFGHPLDTLSLTLCALFAALSSWEGHAVYMYIGLAICSSLFIAKDEWVHRRESSGSENWLHAVLFQLHPLALISLGLLGYGRVSGVAGYGAALWFQIGLMTVFGLYQLVYWNLRVSTDA